jgi:putative PIN family toxin of toxin-antitoxin system
LIRAVIDTSILIRAIIKPQGSVGPVITHLRDEGYQAVCSFPLLEELVATLSLPRIRRKYHFTDGDVAAIVALLLVRGLLVIPQRRIEVCRDRSDNLVLEAAVAGQADYIVTGDEDLLVLRLFEGIRIVEPAEFLRALEEAR